MHPLRWTDENRLETDPGGLEPVSDISPGDYDNAMNTGLWTDPGKDKSRGKSKAKASSSVPDPDQLASARRVAERVQTMQSDPALFEAMPSDEIAEAQRLARHSREAQRRHEHDLAEQERAEQRAEDEHQAQMRRRHRQARERMLETRERHQRAADPSHRVVVLSRLARWLPLAALLPGLISVLLGAFNAGTELNRLSPDTAVVNWLFEPMLSMGVLVILVTQWWGGVPSALHSLKDAAGESGLGAKLRAAMANGFFVAETSLFLATCAMQVGIHYLGSSGDTGSAPWVWAIVPTGLLISMGLVPAVSARMNRSLSVAMREAERALALDESTTVDAEGDRTEHRTASTGGDPSRQERDENTGEGTEKPAEHLPGSASRGVITKPAKRRSRDELRAELHRLIDSGEVTATSPKNTVAKKLSVRWQTARDLLNELD